MDSPVQTKDTAKTAKKETGTKSASAKPAAPAKKTPNAPSKPAKPGTEIVALKPGALSIEVGPRVLEMLDSADKEETKLLAAKAGLDAKRYTALGLTTEAIVKAARADESLSLTPVFGKDQKLINNMNQRLYIALGLKTIIQTATGKDSVVYSDKAKKFFPTGKKNKTDPDEVRRKTRMTNFSHLLKKCAQAASKIVDDAANTAVFDDKAGTLAITGPVTKEVFGVKDGPVLLNEKKLEGMSEKPSFIALGKIAAAKHGAVVTPRKDSRTITVSTETAIIQQCESLVKSLSVFDGEVSEAMNEALLAAASAIEQHAT